jgi:hypothetical protein
MQTTSIPKSRTSEHPNYRLTDSDKTVFFDDLSQDFEHGQ